MSAIFISYRRSDSEGEAGRLADDLSRRFGEDAVFMDVDTIQPGRDFRKAIDESIRSCNVLLAIVGPEWLGAIDGGGERRLADNSDYVRLEIASALQRDIAVIPVMVRGARMPVADLLPDDLKDLAYRNAVELTHARWRSDVQFLMDALRPLLTPATPAPESTPVAPLAAPAPEPSPSPEPRQAPPAIDTATLQQVTRELARYIGPIAQVVVKRATRRCTTLPELLAAVGEEIESPRDRAAFQASLRQ